MKKLALALVCLVSVAFFASCDPKVENPEPAISVLTEAGYAQNGDVINENDTIWFGFKVASNAETAEELATLVVKIDGEEWDNVNLAGKTEYTYTSGVIYPSARDSIVRTSTITAIVTDAANKTNTASIELSVNYHEELVPAAFEWKRANGADGTGLADFGLQWKKNVKEVFAVIEPITNEKVTMYSVPAEKWNSVVTEADKAALFADGGAATVITDYRGISMAATHNYDVVIATLYNSKYYLMHITKCTVERYTFTITGEWK